MRFEFIIFVFFILCEYREGIVYKYGVLIDCVIGVIVYGVKNNLYEIVILFIFFNLIIG